MRTRLVGESNSSDCVFKSFPSSWQLFSLTKVLNVERVMTWLLPNGSKTIANSDKLSLDAIFYSKYFLLTITLTPEHYREGKTKWEKLNKRQPNPIQRLNVPLQKRIQPPFSVSSNLIIWSTTSVYSSFHSSYDPTRQFPRCAIM